MGGGTPSQLSMPQLQQIFSCIAAHTHIEPDAEITLEANPDDLNEAFVGTLTTLPVNRLSIGIQSFDDHLLRFIHRRHTAQQAIEAVERCRDAGFQNISIDLMFGFPEQTQAQWQHDLDTALAIAPQHISAYSLMYEQGTKLTQMLQAGEINEIDEELSLLMYHQLTDTLQTAGYEHYEISNFARPGFRSRHNSSYWHDVPYIGIGAGAHSYDGHRRSWNPSSLPIYIKGIETHSLRPEYEQLAERQHYDECVMTGLRTCEGIDLNQLAERFGTQRRNYCLRMAQPHLKAGKLQLSDDQHLRLTKQGIFVSNDIMADLMADD